jgi:bacterioferritin-associated ferredoxin
VLVVVQVVQSSSRCRRVVTLLLFRFVYFFQQFVYVCSHFQSTGTRITVYSVCCPRSTDRIVQILGKPSDCGECIKQIIALVKEVISIHTIMSENSLLICLANLVASEGTN